jgi:hypothetical protein
MGHRAVGDGRMASSPGPRRRGPAASLRSAGAAVVGFVLAVLLVAFAIATEPPRSAPHPLGGYVEVNCPTPSERTCVLASAGSAWSIAPVAAWCVPLVRPEGSGPNQTNGTTNPGERCTASVVALEFNSSVNATLVGAISVTGPFVVWLVTAAAYCFLLWGTLGPSASGCPAPVGSYPPYSWNASLSRAGSLDLHQLVATEPAPPTIPPSAWYLVVADTGASDVSVAVTTPIVAAAS